MSAYILPWFGFLSGTERLGYLLDCTEFTTLVSLDQATVIEYIKQMDNTLFIGSYISFEINCSVYTIRSIQEE